MTKPRRRRHRAFTLIEVMLTVAIVGAVAALAVYSVRRFLATGKARADADDAMLAMGAAIRAYYDQNRGYLDCSTGFDDFYPMEPNDKKHVLNNPQHAEHGCWSLYNVRMGPTYMSFSVRAGTKNDTPPTLPWLNITYPKPKEPWFILVGTMDLDKDKVYGRYVVSSFSPGVIHRVNEGE